MGLRHNFFEKWKIHTGIFLWSSQKTLNDQIWTNPRPENLGGKCQKIAYFKLWAIFRGLVRASEINFRKNEKYAPGYSSGVPEKPYKAKYEQTHDREFWGNYVTKITYFGLKKPQKWPKNSQKSLFKPKWLQIHKFTIKMNQQNKNYGRFFRTDGRTDISKI